ncbi:MAG: 30S ribosomal protein S17 [Halobacteriovoraceae bacterium]|jgi:small subunit ribosomal protein S17|nr:30S ribosomal protein S17 [Halobacteriovoraceae bacterium]
MSNKEEGFKRMLKGEVVSDSGDKTIVVTVQRRFKHPIYSKYVTKSKKYHAHDEKNMAKKGDQVTIIESRSHSKLKKWELFTTK